MNQPTIEAKRTITGETRYYPIIFDKQGRLARSEYVGYRSREKALAMAVEIGKLAALGVA